MLAHFLAISKTQLPRGIKMSFSLTLFLSEHVKAVITVLFRKEKKPKCLVSMRDERKTRSKVKSQRYCCQNQLHAWEVPTIFGKVVMALNFDLICARLFINSRIKSLF